MNPIKNPGGNLGVLYEIQIKINKKKVIPYLCCSIFTEQSSIHFTMDKLFFNLYTIQWPGEKGQTTIYKALHRKLKIEQHKCH
jgi:hypothetical protein